VRRVRRQCRRERNDDLVDDRRVDEGVEAALKDRPTGKRGELLRLIGAEPQAPAARGDDC
jgi:hypothetical protein